MRDRQIANIDISKEYDESLGTDDVHYQSFARMAAFFTAICCHIATNSTFRCISSIADRLSYSLTIIATRWKRPVCPDAAVSTSCVYYGV